MGTHFLPLTTKYINRGSRPMTCSTVFPLPQSTAASTRSLSGQEVKEHGIIQEPHKEVNSLSTIDMLAIDTSVATFLSSESERNSPIQSSPRQDSSRHAAFQQLQDLLLSTSKVGRLVTVAPRAGPFEGQLVALVAPAKRAAPRKDLDEGLCLVPPAENESGRRLIQELRTVVSEWGTALPRPDVWVLVQRLMCDGRQAQTWVQNMAAEMANQVMAMQWSQRWMQRRSDVLSEIGTRTYKAAETELKWKTDGERLVPRLNEEYKEPQVDAASATVPTAHGDEGGDGEEGDREGSDGEGETEHQRATDGDWGPKRTVTADIGQEQATKAAIDVGHGKVTEGAAATGRRNQERARATDAGQKDEQKNGQKMHDAGAVTNTNSDAFVFPLSPVQQLFFRTTVARSIQVASVSGTGFRFSQSILLRVRGSIPLAEIETAVACLVTRHSMLRAQFRLTPGGWAQTIASVATAKAHYFEHRYAATESDVLAALEHARRSLNLFNGPVFAAEHIRTCDNRQLLFLVAHHLVVDVDSWRILLQDLNTLLRDGAVNSPLPLSFTRWVDLQSLDLETPRLRSRSLDAPDLAYWDLSGFSNCYGDTEEYNFSLNPHVAAALRWRCNEPLRTQPSHILMASLIKSYCHAFPKQSAPTVWNQESGRSWRVQNTVGWFTTLCPVAVQADSETDPVHLVRLVKDAHRAAAQTYSRTFPLGFSDATQVSSVPIQIMFNCVENLNQLVSQDALLEPVTSPDRDVETLSGDIGPQVGRISLFEMSVVIDESDVQVEFLFNAHTEHQDRILIWMNTFQRIVADTVTQLLTMKPELTLAEAPLLRTSYEALERFGSSRLPEGLSSVSNIESIDPVSPLQQEMLIAQGQDSSSYSISCTWEFESSDGLGLDQKRFYESWEKLIARHPCLRTIFIDSISDDGLFDKVLLKKICPEMLFLDSPHPARALASTPPVKFMPSQPRHRLSVSRSPAKTCLRLDVSQALCDASWTISRFPCFNPDIELQIFTINILFTQLEHEYAAKNTLINDAVLKEHPRQVASTVSPQILDTCWTAILSGARRCIFPRLMRQPTMRLHVQSLDLAVSGRDYEKFCKNHDIEPSVVVKLAWALVLRCFVAEDKVCFGYQLQRPGRDWMKQMAGALGSFDGVVACVVDLGGLSKISQVLHDIQQNSIHSCAQGVPPVSEIEHALDLRGEHLFNSCVSFLDSTTAGASGKLISATFDANCDVSLCITMDDERLRCDMTYRGLNSSQAHNVMNSFGRAMQVILRDALQTISDVDLVTEHDLEQIMRADWTTPRTDLKLCALLDEMILRQARQSPHATAIAAWDGEFCYEQVDSYVEKLATSLVNMGIAPGALVPVVLDKCRWSPIIMLAVLKAGACFVAIDSQDASSAKTLISQLQAPLVVVTESAWTQTGPLASNCLVIGQANFDLVPPQVTLGLHQRSPKQAACVFLSPGPSGPKGMFYTHESLCTIFAAQGPLLGLGACSRVLQLSAYNVDIALVEVLATLLHGGCVCIPSAHERINDLEGVIARMDVTWSYLTPVLARKMQPSAVPNLRTVCFRTRSLDQLTYGPWLDGRTVLLVYGAPDICPLAISISRLSESVTTEILGPPLLGRFLILDPEDPRKMAPIGAVGELAIDSPLITPHKFILGEALVDAASLQEPQRKAGWRYLRTNHRAQYLDGGHVRYLGSMREQTGVNGSAALVADAERQARLCLKSNQDMVIEPITTSDAMHLLVAFIDLDGNLDLGPYDLTCLGPEIKNKLFTARHAIESELGKTTKIGAKMPWQCMPAAFVPLRGFPLSASLKVNRRKLHKMVSSMSCSQLMGLADGQYSLRLPNDDDGPPIRLTRAQEAMQRLWARVLDSSAANIKLSDSFLDAGGDTWLAARLAVLCRQNGFSVSVHDIVRGARLSEVCRRPASGLVSERGSEPKAQDDDAVVTHRLSAVGTELSKLPYHALVKHVLAPQIGVPWVQVLGAAAVSSQQVACLESSLYSQRGDVCCLILDFNGPIMFHRLEAACHGLTKLHPVLRTVFAAHDCRAYQVVIASLKFALSHQLCEPQQLDTAVDEVVAKARCLPLHLSRPITRFTFVEDGHRGRLVLQFSTAQISRGCIPQLVHHLVQLYVEAESVSAKPTFLAYCHEAMQNASYSEAIQHWRRRLEGARMTHIVANKKPRGPVASITKLHETVDVSPLADLGIDFETVLKTAWALVLASLAGRDDVVFGQRVGHGGMGLTNSTLDVSSMVGPMERMVPVRVRIPITHTSPLQMMLQVQRDSASSCRFETLGAHTIISQCTDWPGWAGFSSVVCHGLRGPTDGSTTLNMGSTTFTYRLVEPPASPMADIVVSSNTLRPGRVSLSLAFPAGLVPADFGSTTMGLLVEAVKTLACYETVSEPILAPSSGYKSLTPMVPLPEASGVGGAQDALADDSSEAISDEQHQALRDVVAATWRQVLLPHGSGEALGAAEDEARFYDVAGCLLPAYTLAQDLNRGLSRLGMTTFGTIALTPEDMIRHPTMAAQRLLLARKMHRLGLAARSVRRRHFSILGHGLLDATAAAPPPSWHHRKPSPSSSGGAGAPWPTRRKSRHGSMRELGTRAGDWVRHHVSMSRDRIPLMYESPRLLSHHQSQQQLATPRDDVSPLTCSSPGDDAWGDGETPMYNVSP